MEAITADQLKRVIDQQHGGESSFLQSFRVYKAAPQPDAWDGIVHVFELKNNAKASRAYAWATPIAGSSKPRYFAVLHQGKVVGPAEAVKAAASAIQTQASAAA